MSNDIIAANQPVSSWVNVEAEQPPDWFLNTCSPLFRNEPILPCTNHVPLFSVFGFMLKPVQRHLAAERSNIFYGTVFSIPELLSLFSSVLFCDLFCTFSSSFTLLAKRQLACLFVLSLSWRDFHQQTLHSWFLDVAAKRSDACVLLRTTAAVLRCCCGSLFFAF